jgi:hypothetical protein
MGVKTSEECLYLALMLRWENVGVADSASCTAGGKTAINSQIERLAYILRKIGPGADEGRFQTLSLNTRRQDGRSYISKDSSWMENPENIGDGWFFEGCTNLPQKREILRALRKVGYSTPFVECCQEFVAGKSVRKFIPTEKEAERIRAEPAPRGLEGFEMTPDEVQQFRAALS